MGRRLESLRLGQMLVKANLITPEQLAQALALQKTSGGRIGSNLAKLGYISEEEIASFLSRQYGVPPADLNNVKIDPAVIKFIPAEVADRHLVIPLNRTGSTLTVAMANPSDIFVIDDLRFMTGCNINPMVAIPLIRISRFSKACVIDSRRNITIII